MNTIQDKQLRQLFEQWANESVEDIIPLPLAGSNRRYFRLLGKTNQAIGAWNEDRKENQTFVDFTKHFHAKGIPVPELLGEDLDNDVYLLQDLGDESLLHRVQQLRTKDAFPETLILLYQKALVQLAKMQIVASQGLDYSKCYSTSIFDQQPILWDLQYFKYYFLKPTMIPFKEHLLEKDFQTLADFLSPKKAFFMFRDFQSRNIMLVNDEPYFIDYQGGMQGAIQYDAASLLFQARAKVPHSTRAELLDFYIQEVQKYTQIDESSFRAVYYANVFIRMIQVLGSYGFRGLFQKREHFIKSIPAGLANIAWFLNNINLAIDIPHLKECLLRLSELKQFQTFDTTKGEKSPLKVKVASFSYKKSGIPSDNSGNGGGFVFDCRAIHNPGRYTPYKKLTGRDQAVIDFLKTQSNIEDFLGGVLKIVEPAIENYIERNFTSLLVSFGCTGGQHRSVYSADYLAKHLKEKYGIEIELKHFEQPQLKV